MAEVLAEVLRRPEAEREAYIAEACTDAAAADDVRSLLAAVISAGAFLEGPTEGGAPAIAASASLREPPGALIGPYKVLQFLGEGGFGSVYMAEQQAPVVRRVALKIVKPGMDTGQVIARFEAERQALSMMDHPNIARVLDAGATPAGRPYFAMELVRGTPITAYCDSANLTTAERLAIFIPVCRAVQHAHTKGIIHRDLKPGNVLVTLHDGVPVPKVIDFGIAKATLGRLTERTLFTDYRQLIGTPEYMSPEQAEMSGLDVDTRSDVYSLGVLLYELLTGSTPFDPRQLRSAAFAEMQRIIREVEPPRPSTRLSTLADALPAVAACRRTEPGRLGAIVRGDLDWIVMKALEKDRRRRYDTAADLGADVQRHLDREPVVAAPPGRTYRARKFVRRHRGPVVAGGLIACALIAGLAGTTAGLLRARAAGAEVRAQRDAAVRARDAADRERMNAEAVARFMRTALRFSDPEQGGSGDARVSEAMLGALRALEAGEFRNQPEIDAGLRLTISNILNDNARSAEALPVAQRALETLRDLHPGDGPETAKATNNLANVLKSLGRYDQAEPLYRDALAMRRRLNGGDHAEVAESLNNLAGLFNARGRHADAEPLYREALAMRTRLFEGDHEDTQQSLNNLAYTLHELGRPREAEPVYRQSLAMARRLHAGDHPAVARALNNLADVLLDEGNAEDARRMLEEALAMERRLYPADHPRVAESLSNLGATLAAMGHPDRAETLLREALAIDQRLYPGDHPEVAQDLNNVGVAVLEQERADQAEPLLRGAVDMFQRLSPGDQPRKANALTNLARCLAVLGRTTEALALAQQAADMAGRCLPAGHPIRTKCEDRLSELARHDPQRDQKAGPKSAGR
jgi:serine/threonine protein kinase/tetratricopeptide (TPR) repeat protein